MIFRKLLASLTLVAVTTLGSVVDAATLEIGELEIVAAPTVEYPDAVNWSFTNTTDSNLLIETPFAFVYSILRIRSSSLGTLWYYYQTDPGDTELGGFNSGLGSSTTEYTFQSYAEVSTISLTDGTVFVASNTWDSGLPDTELYGISTSLDISHWTPGTYDILLEGTIQPIPLPASLPLMLAGLTWLAWMSRRQYRDR
jgi:hypothetical protein